MIKILGAALAAALSCAGTAAQGQELRVGFLNTTTGGGALLGGANETGWKLGLEHQGWTKDGDSLGGVPTRIFYADDQAKPEVGLREVEKFIRSDKVHVVAGIIWSNVIMAVQKPVFDAKLMMLGSVGGPTPLAGELCNPLYVNVSHINDGSAEATGELATSDAVKTVIAMAPNYQAGKDNIAGFERTYKGGRIADRILYKIGEADFQADFSRIRAAKPEAVVGFFPGAMGVAFVKQWAASGLSKDIKLYTILTIDHLTLPAIGDSAIGAVEAHFWDPGLDTPVNKRFIKSYVEKHGQLPSFVAVTGYDAATVLAQGMRAVGGKTGDMAAVARAIRKSTIVSPRGTIALNVNGFPIQPYWKIEILRGEANKPVLKAIGKIMERPDSYWEKCPADRRT